MTFFFAFLTVLIAGLMLAERMVVAWERFREWERIQIERERRRALRVASGHGPRSLPS